jgi:predicted AAA+ superfamily ATPase
LILPKYQKIGTLGFAKFLFSGTLGDMSYIYRELHQKLENQMISYLDTGLPKGLILTGIVGSGKSTLIHQVLADLSEKISIFTFNGDDSLFRQKILEDSKYIYDHVTGKTTKKAIVFVDEVQKCPEVFDALKIAFDLGKYSFIVSGSNPAFLSTIAKKRLQRRADQWFLLPLSLRELFYDQTAEKPASDFENILWNIQNCHDVKIPDVELKPDFEKRISSFFLMGGLPLVNSAVSLEDKLREIRLTIERGFELMSVDNNSVAEFTRVELAKLSGVEFTYKNILEKSRIRKRDLINVVIDDLMNHGYLVKRKPLFLDSNRTSYLSIYSYTDPGVITYLTGDLDVESRLGRLVEGYVHARLFAHGYNYPLKSEIAYYKPYTIEEGDRLRYLPGEVDFVFIAGKRRIPMEVKTTHQRSSIDVTKISEFISKYKCPFGVVLYGGVPYVDKKNNLIYWPFWLI